MKYQNLKISKASFGKFYLPACEAQDERVGILNYILIFAF